MVKHYEKWTPGNKIRYSCMLWVDWSTHSILKFLADPALSVLGDLKGDYELDPLAALRLVSEGVDLLDRNQT